MIFGKKKLEGSLALEHVLISTFAAASLYDQGC